MSAPWEGEGGARMVEQPPAEADRERRSYIVGFLLALLLTAAAFGLAAFRLLSGPASMAAIGTLAVAQIAVQFRFFLHIDLSRQKREDLQLILFTALLVLIMVAGSIWILTSLDQRMMG
jgi:cytochrome o ubiquinol oxidase operon protein cyoD